MKRCGDIKLSKIESQISLPCGTGTKSLSPLSYRLLKIISFPFRSYEDVPTIIKALINWGHTLPDRNLILERSNT